VAFVQEKGVHLIERELEQLQQRKVAARLLVTTTFQTTSAPALGLAKRLGLEVRVLNPGSGSTFYPNLYLGRFGEQSRAVIGSANLTGGLATNLEAAVALQGRRTDGPIARAWSWAETLWSDRRVVGWQPEAVLEGEGERIEPALYAAILKEWRRDPVFMTLGTRSPNRVTEVTQSGLHVETPASKQKGRGDGVVPAWMFNLAWDRLHTHGVLTHLELREEYRVHRSAAVFAVLGRIPGVSVENRGRAQALRWAL